MFYFALLMSSRGASVRYTLILDAFIKFCASGEVANSNRTLPVPFESSWICHLLASSYRDFFARSAERRTGQTSSVRTRPSEILLTRLSASTYVEFTSPQPHPPHSERRPERARGSRLSGAAIQALPGPDSVGVRLDLLLRGNWREETGPPLRPQPPRQILPGAPDSHIVHGYYNGELCFRSTRNVIRSTTSMQIPSRGGKWHREVGAAPPTTIVLRGSQILYSLKA